MKSSLVRCLASLMTIGVLQEPKTGLLIDEIVTVSSEMSFEVSRMLARVEGIPGGISTGANLAAALTVAQRPEMAGKTIVTFAPSCAERYFSSELFADLPKT